MNRPDLQSRARKGAVYARSSDADRTLPGAAL